MGAKPSASIILNTANRADRLRLCLPAYLDQTKMDFEMVVTDDTSTDDTEDVVRDFARRAPFRVAYLRQELEGHRRAATLNLGIRATRSDFLIFTEEMCRFTEGGVILNIGTAIMGPEVVLKAVSMAANVGCKPDGLWTADFDIRPFVFDDEVRDESQAYYYLRDQKSIATRIPKVFDGVGFYFEGLHADTLPALYQYVMRKLDSE